MKTVVLAGGLGTRLRQAVRDVPKPMADIGGTPFLALLLENLRAYGADTFILCVSHLRHVIREYFGESFHGVPVRYSEEETPLGTGGAVKQALRQFGLDEALVVNGDTFVQARYDRFWADCAGEPLAVLLKAVDDAGRYGSVETRGGRIVAFREKSETGAGLVNAGVYRVQAGLFRDMPRRFSLEKDLLEPKIAELCPRCFLAEDYFIDIGVPESYARACRELPERVRQN
ncbi:sugar phosphate nucleotidyltransferase [uncultured Mailhella sp.]|uniref:sugar phosphate nucleotidyltransferase n=1 Tax=uncultured Mailhella sp. TaxID=1981031 RepID=UPI00263391B6|nr:sugar phosphate nucleotidyltransferase [uncultured Mailhella sp.]